jgi:hypothetical protein
MTDRRDIRGEMRSLLLDRDTADRLLTGHVEPDDAPPGYAHVAELLRSASLCPPIDAERERATVIAMVGEVRSHLQGEPSRHERRPITRFVRAKVVALAVGAMLVGSTGLAFAGALPGAAQGVAQTMLAKIGVTVPGPNPHATTHSSPVPVSPLGTPSPLLSLELSPGAWHGQAGQPHGQAGQPHGQAGQPHGQAGQPHGEAGLPHGEAGQPHGEAGQPHGEAGQSHGEAGQSHGQAGLPHGEAGQPNGDDNSSTDNERTGS